MAYNPTNWKSGDVVTSAKLNKLEQGVADAGGGGVLVVNVVLNSPTSTPTLDKTWQEIHDADLSVVVSKGANAKTALVTDVIAPASSSSLVHTVRTIGTNGGSASIEQWTTMSPDDYPKLAHP